MTTQASLLCMRPPSLWTTSVGSVIRSDGEYVDIGSCDEMRDMMQAKVGIIRTKNELEEALEDIKSFKERALACSSGTSRKYNSGWHQALDLINMADVSHAATLAAVTREESRGGHTRDDFPTPEDEYWGQTLNIIWMENGEMKIRQEPVEEMRTDLKEALTEVKTMIAERAAEAGGGN